MWHFYINLTRSIILVCSKGMPALFRCQLADTRLRICGTPIGILSYASIEHIIVFNAVEHTAAASGEWGFD